MSDDWTPLKFLQSGRTGTWDDYSRGVRYSRKQGEDIKVMPIPENSGGNLLGKPYDVFQADGILSDDETAAYIAFWEKTNGIKLT